MNSIDHDLSDLYADDKGVILRQIKPNQVFLLEDDHRIFFNCWAAGNDLGDYSCLLNLPVFLLASQTPRSRPGLY